MAGMPTALSPALSRLVARLDRYPQVLRATVFGSAVEAPDRARDLDLAFCLDQPHSDRALRRIHPLLSVASYGTTLYGLMDVFVQFSDRLWVRDGDCVRFVRARNARGLRGSICRQGVPWKQWRQGVCLDPSVKESPAAPRTVYFAHPMSTYGKAEERRAIATLEAEGLEVVNPNLPVHQRTCGKDIAKWEALAASCDAVAVLPFPDGSVGAGIVAEVAAARAQDKPVYLMDSQGTAFWPVLAWPGALVLLSLEETREKLRQARESEEANPASIMERRPRP